MLGYTSLVVGRFYKVALAYRRLKEDNRIRHRMLLLVSEEGFSARKQLQSGKSNDVRSVRSCHQRTTESGMLGKKTCTHQANQLPCRTTSDTDTARAIAFTHCAMGIASQKPMRLEPQLGFNLRVGKASTPHFSRFRCFQSSGVSFSIP